MTLLPQSSNLAAEYIFSFKTPKNTSDNTTELTEIPHSTKYYNICQNTNQIIQDIQNNMSATDGIQLPHQAYTIR